MGMESFQHRLRGLGHARRPHQDAFDEMQQDLDQPMSFSSLSYSPGNPMQLPLTRQIPASYSSRPESRMTTYDHGDQFIREQDAPLDEYDRALLAEANGRISWQAPGGRTRLSLASQPMTSQHSLQTCAFNEIQDQPMGSQQCIYNFHDSPRSADEGASRCFSFSTFLSKATRQAKILVQKIFPDKLQGSTSTFDKSPLLMENSSSPFSIASSPSFQVDQRRKAQSVDRIRESGRNLTKGSCSHEAAIKSAGPALSICEGELLPVVQGIQLVSLNHLPDRFRSLFPFKLFNAVQSGCFHHVYNSNKNVVLSAPTGSGKTVVLELAICQLMAACRNDQYTIVYMAPTKSLCSERQRDWDSKFKILGLSCAELTGDTDASQFRKVQNASIIITTPEKWDSTTRKWKDQKRLIELVKLFLIDEVHILKDSRGATLEAVVSRMKSTGKDVRFVALSATIPNSEDIAKWLGNDSTNTHLPAVRKVFGEEFRPVTLQKHVYALAYRGNDFGFDSVCRKRLPEIIAKHSAKKPIMVFCCTRSSATETAKFLGEAWKTSSPGERKWTGRGQLPSLQDPILRDVMIHGVAFHHAGLDQSDRAAVELGFLEGYVSVICCTSTLAVGVNLPCHLVIIQNTVTWQDSGLKEYSDLEITQMLGRAGRPQFDETAVAVVITKQEKAKKYEQLVAGGEVLESCLHINLVEHLNAEISLGTIHDLQSAKRWLAGTFLYVRLAQNPEHYKLDGEVQDRSIEVMIEQVCKRDLCLLQEADLVNNGERLRCTGFGQAMAQHYVKFQSMRAFLSLPAKARISEILSVLAGAEEFHEVRLRGGEKPLYRALNSAHGIKFPIQAVITSPTHKRSIIIQAELGGVDFPMDEQFTKQKKQYHLDRGIIFSNIWRLVRCIIDCQLHTQDATAARNALELGRSLGARVWDNSPMQMKQIQGLGPVAVRKLVNAGINSIEALEATDPSRINLLLSKQHGFGYSLKQKLNDFPKLRVSVKLIRKILKKNEPPLVQFNVDVAFMNDKIPEVFNKKCVYVSCLAERSDGYLIDFKRISARFIGKESLRFSTQLLSESHTIVCYAMCDEIAGTLRFAELTPKLPVTSFPRAPLGISSTYGAGSPFSRTKTNLPHTYARAGFLSASEVLIGEDQKYDHDVDDSDLVAAADQVEFRRLEDIESSIAKRQIKSLPNKDSLPDRDERDRLENGKWACSHKCKNKTTCKHICCREGIEKPRKRTISMHESKEQKEIPYIRDGLESGAEQGSSVLETLPRQSSVLSHNLSNEKRDKARKSNFFSPKKGRQQPSAKIEDDGWTSDLPPLSPLLRVKPRIPGIAGTGSLDGDDFEFALSDRDCRLSGTSNKNLESEGSAGGGPGQTPDMQAATIDFSNYSSHSLLDTKPSSPLPGEKIIGESKFSVFEMSDIDRTKEYTARTETNKIKSRFFTENKILSKRALSETSSDQPELKRVKTSGRQDSPFQSVENTQAHFDSGGEVTAFQPFENMDGIDLALIAEFKDFVDFTEDSR